MTATALMYCKITHRNHDNVCGETIVLLSQFPWKLHNNQSKKRKITWASWNSRRLMCWIWNWKSDDVIMAWFIASKRSISNYLYTYSRPPLSNCMLQKSLKDAMCRKLRRHMEGAQKLKFGSLYRGYSHWFSCFYFLFYSKYFSRNHENHPLKTG